MKTITKTANFTDRTRTRIFTLIEYIVASVRNGNEKVGESFHIYEDDLRKLWKKAGLISDSQTSLGDSVDPIVKWIPKVSLGQITATKTKGLSGLTVTVNYLGPKGR